MHPQSLTRWIVRQSRKLLGLLRIIDVASSPHHPLGNDNTPRFDRRRKTAARRCRECQGTGSAAGGTCRSCQGLGCHVVDLSAVTIDVRAALAMMRGCGRAFRGNGGWADAVVFDREVVSAAVGRLWHAVQDLDGHPDVLFPDAYYHPRTESATDRQRRTITDAECDAEWRRSLVRTDG